MVPADLNPVRLDVAPGDFRVVQQHPAPECTPNPIAFCWREPIGLQYGQSPYEEGIILGNLCFDEAEPWLHLSGGQDVRLFERERFPRVLAPPKNPVELAPLLEVFRADVASRGNTISGSALELVVTPHFIKRIRPGAILICLCQIE